MARAASDESDGMMIQGHVSEELGSLVIVMFYTLMARLCPKVLCEYIFARPFLAQVFLMG